MRKTFGLVAACCLVGIAAPAAASAPPAPAPTPRAAPPGQATDPLAQQIQLELQQQAMIDAAKQTLLGTVEASKAQRSTLSALVDQEQKSIEETTAHIAAAEQRLHDANRRAEAEKARAAGSRLRAEQDKTLLVMSMRARYTRQDGLVQYVLASGDFSEMMARAASVTTLVNRSSDLLAQLKRDVAEADMAQKAAEGDAALAAAEAAALNAQGDQLQAQITHENELIQTLSDQERAANAEVQLANSQSLGLVQQIAALRVQELDATIAAAESADWQAATFYLQNHLGTVPTPVPIDPASAARGVRFVWPAPGAEITQTFGPSPYFFEPSAFGFPHFHTGIDLGAPMGTPIYAAGDGIVAVAAESTVGYGNHVILAHDVATLTLYGHLQAMAVQPGQPVRQGQLIGLMGSTGNSTGPHLHFEVRVSDHPADPAPFLPSLPPGASGPPALTTH